MKISAIIKPGAKNDAIELRDGVYYVRTKASAVEGRANTAAIKLLADYFNVPKTRVRITQGATSRHKVFEINGVE